MPEFKPKTRAKGSEILNQALEGELALYEQVGLFTRAITPKSAYRYRGVLLQYQKALQGKPPSVEASRRFLARLREDDFKPATLHLYRAALQGFHTWRGENLDFPIKVPHHLPSYHSADKVKRILSLAISHPRDHVVIRLQSDAGLRRGEVVRLRVRNIDFAGKMLRTRGKGDKDRVIPLTRELYELLDQFCRGKDPDEFVVGVKDKGVYGIVKKYAALAGEPDFHPHDLRHAFATRLVEGGANIRAIQELLGHTDLKTTAVYLGVAPKHLEEAIRILDSFAESSGQNSDTVTQTPTPAPTQPQEGPNLATQHVHPFPRVTTSRSNADPIAAALRAMLDPANHIQALENVENVQVCELSAMLDPANHIQALKNVENVQVYELSAMLDPANHIQALKNVENVQFSELPVVSSDSVKRHRRPSGKAA